MNDSANAAAPFDVAARYETEAEADSAVETLVLGGVGATTEPAADGTGFTVLVVPGEADRAAGLLGLPFEPPLTPPTTGRSQVVWILVVFAAGMVILPAIAFFVSYKLSGG